MCIRDSHYAAAYGAAGGTLGTVLGSVAALLFVVDPKKERICIKEAQALGITLIGIADTNCDPDELDYVIPRCV